MVMFCLVGRLLGGDWDVGLLEVVGVSDGGPLVRDLRVQESLLLHSCAVLSCAALLLDRLNMTYSLTFLVDFLII